MTKSFADELIESMTEALDHAQGKKTGARVHVIDVPDVQSQRAQLNRSKREPVRRAIKPSA